MEKYIRSIDTPLFKVLWMPMLPLRSILPDHIKNHPRSIEHFAARTLMEHEFQGEVFLSHAENGRPRLSPAINRADAYCPPISISHGAGIIALACSKTAKPIGVDVEGPRGQLLRVYSRFLRPEEYPEEISVASLLPLWTAKEAAWKAMADQPPSLKDVNLDNFKLYSYRIEASILLTVALPKDD